MLDLKLVKDVTNQKFELGHSEYALLHNVQCPLIY